MNKILVSLVLAVVLLIGLEAVGQTIAHVFDPINAALKHQQ